MTIQQKAVTVRISYLNEVGRVTHHTTITKRIEDVVEVLERYQVQEVLSFTIDGMEHDIRKVLQHEN